MRTHGWAGSPPATNHEAVDRIIGATHRCVRRHGRNATISHVASELGVSRQTVYRYFASTEQLLTEAAIDGTEEFMTRLARRLRKIDQPADAIVEAIAYTVDQLPVEPYLQLLVGAGGHSLVQSVTSPLSREIGCALLEQTAVDWDALGLPAEATDELIEWALRTVQSFLLDPGEPARSPAALRAFLRRWLAPAVIAVTSTAPRSTSPRRAAS